MPIQVECPSCRASFRAGEENAGKRGRCPKCKTVFRVPEPKPADPVEGDLVPIEDEKVVAEVGLKPLSTPRKAVVEDEEDGLYALGGGALSKPKAAPVREAALPGVGVSAAGVKTAAAAIKRSMTPGQILAGFGGEIEPVKPTPFYRFWIAVVAGVMLLLPLVYLSMIGLVVYGVYYHAVHNVSIFENMGHGRNAGKAVVFFYFGPIVAGSVVAAFMLKPFFARSAKLNMKERELDPQREPLLFAFVDGVCTSVGAPRPARVLVDCQVNAGARLEGGMLAVIGGQLVLQIGLPLVAGLTLKQFAGVLAHEFGHFSQAAGMRLGQLIRRVNMWFARVVYERDHWDQKLAEWSSGGDGYVMGMALVIRLAVWITRRVLWVLMYTGHAVSGILSRQMEFDADRYEARMVGSRVFTQTCWQLQVLNLAYQGAFADMRSSWQQKRMPDSLPKLVLANVPQLPQEMLALHRKAMSETKTGIFDTHPCDRDRIANAKAEVPGEGLFTLDGPATDVFRDFDSLSRAATLDFYKENLGPEITKEQLFPVAELVETQTVAQEGEVACRRFFLDSPNYTKKLPLPWDAPKAPTDAPAAKRAVVAARQTMESAHDDFLKATKAWEEASTACVNAEAGMLLAKTECKFKPKDFGLTSPKLKDAERTRDAAQAEANEQLAAMLPFSEAAARRIVQTLGILKVDTVAKKIPDGTARREEAFTLYTCVAHLGANVMPAMAPVIHAQRVAITLLQYFHKGNNEKNAPLINAILRAVATLRDVLEEFRWKLGDTIYYPFEHAQEDITLARFALPAIMPEKEDIGGVMGAAEAACERVVVLYARALGRLTVTAEEVERAMGLEPIKVEAAKEPEA